MTHESKGMCILGRSGHEQVRASGPRAAAASAVWWQAVGEGRGAGRSGAPRGRDAFDRERLERAIAHGRIGCAQASAARPACGPGYGAAARADARPHQRGAGRGFRDRFVDAAARDPADRAALCACVQREPRMARPGLARLLLPAPRGTGAGARRGGDPALEAQALAGSKKTPRNKAESSSSSTSRD